MFLKRRKKKKKEEKKVEKKRKKKKKKKSQNQSQKIYQMNCLLQNQLETFKRLFLNNKDKVGAVNEFWEIYAPE